MSDQAPVPRAAVASVDTYRARIHRVMDHVDRHLAESLDLARLAGVAHFSPWHFHRLFQALTGETLADFVRRRRLEIAAGLLLRTPAPRALTIALDCGFGSAEVFTRAFRAQFGMTPTAWRRGGWRGWSDARRAELGKIHQAQRKANQAMALSFLDDPQHWPRRPLLLEGTVDMNTSSLELRTLPTLRLAYLRYTGPYGHPGIGATWQRFGRWFGQRGEPRRRMFGISLDDPEITPADKCRYDCAVEVDAAFRPEGEIGVQEFPDRRYACQRFTGTGADIHAAWMRLFAQGLPASGWQPAPAPSLEWYEEDFVVDEQTGAFRCWLCVPVMPL